MTTVALIFGGPSGEHDVSLVSAKNILNGLKDSPFDVLPLGITKDLKWKLLKHDQLAATSFQKPIDLNKVGIEVYISRRGDEVVIGDVNSGQLVGPPINVAFPICHGPFGEDGRLQGFFEILNLPYVGSTTKSCAICLDKILTKSVINHFGIPQVPYFFSHQPDIDLESVLEKFSFPIFVKPANMGSSVGISKVSNADQWQQALDIAFAYDKKIIIEQGRKVQEVEVALLQKGDKVLVTETCEITTDHEFYSYEAKYLDENGARFSYPANISKEAAKKVKEYAITAFKALECRHYVRADFFVTETDEVLFNEINTHPGFTSISQFPTLWAKEGMSYEDLVEHLVNLALKSF